MEDLFEREQNILNVATDHLKEIEAKAVCSPSRYAELVKEYSRLLRQLRRVTRISDKTTVDLNTRKLDLLDKVHYDALTGIYNRRFMEDNLKQMAEHAAASQGILSVLMLDVDYFKRYNDTYGHSMGDECLKSLAGVLRDSLPEGIGFAARYGGEEFVIVLAEKDKDRACAAADKILENVRKLEIPHEKNEAAGCVTISIGVTTGRPDDTQNGTDYVKRADEALYMSKQNGRNRYTFIAYEEEKK